MGYIAAIPAGIFQDPRIKPAHIRVLNALGTFSNLKTGKAMPSHSSIAKVCGLTRGTVCRSLVHVEQCGWVDVVRRTRKSGAQTSNEYTIPFKRTYLEAMVISKQRQNATGGVEATTHQPVQNVATGNREGLNKKEECVQCAHTVNPPTPSASVEGVDPDEGVGPRLPAANDALLEVRTRLRALVGEKVYREFFARCGFRGTSIIAVDRYHGLRLVDDFSSELKAIGATDCVSNAGDFECPL